MDLSGKIRFFSRFSWAYSQEERLHIWAGISSHKFQVLWKQNVSEAAFKENIAFSILLLHFQNFSLQISNRASRVTSRV